MRAGSREFGYVVGGVGLGCLALLAAFVLPGLFQGSDSAQTRIVESSAVPVPQGDTSPAAADLATSTPSREPLATPAVPGSGPGTGATSGTRTGTSPGAAGRSTARPRSTVASAAPTTVRPSATTSDPSASATSAPTSAAPPPAGDQKATFYAPAAPGGACLTLSIPATRYTAAVGPAEFNGSAACGEYLRVTGARGTILVKVDNLCPECAPGHIDLSNEAFAALDDPAKGIVPVSYRVVQDPPVTGSIQVRCKDGSSRFWLALQLDNTGNALASVEVSDRGGPFRPMSRSGNAFWVLADNPGRGPFQVRLTDVAGHVATLPDVTLAVGITQTTGVRLY